MRRPYGLLVLMFVAAGSCAGGDTDTHGPLVGRWQMIQGTDATFQFFSDGRLIGVIDGRQEIGSFEVPEAGQVLMMIEGDTLLADFTVRDDTLRFAMVGESQAFVGVRSDPR